MVSVWNSADLAEEITKNDNILNQTQSVITDIVSGRIDITHIVENMGPVLTSKEVDHRLKGMRFFTKLLKELPPNYLTDIQMKFITKFYTDRLMDNHNVVPCVLEGYLAIIDMKNYSISSTLEFLTVMFREVPCQSQVRQDRYHIYLIIRKLLERDLEYMKHLGPDFVYGIISSIDGERDPRNLMFLFGFLPYFIKHIPLGHLVEEMFDIISCYYPIDFHPSPDDPAPVSRQDLADALCPCLCATPEFGEHCLVLLVEKLDSSLRLAKIDSLRLLAESCQTFRPETYGPFLKTLWASINREISHKTDDELKMAAHQALSALVANLASTANTDQTFENFVKGILISMQTAVAESTTVTQFVGATKLLLTTANACKDSCLIITKSMIPATIAYYEFKPSAKLQVASLDFLGDLYDLAEKWQILVELQAQLKQIPGLCLTAISNTAKEYQIAGFKTLIRVKSVMPDDLVLPFIEVLMYNVQYAQDEDLLKVCVETVHTLGRLYPEQIMSLVVHGKCDLNHVTQDKVALQKRLNLLSNLASIDDFTKVIIQEMLKLILNDADANKVVKALSQSMSDASIYSNEKIAQIESDHGLIQTVLVRIFSELEKENKPLSEHGFSLIATTIASLPSDKQKAILSKHTANVLEKCTKDDIYFLVLESLYNSVNKNVYESTFDDVLKLSVKLALSSEKDLVRTKACIIIAHFLNKAENGQKFDLMYELLKKQLSSCSRDEEQLCSKLIFLYGWITKGLVLRGSDVFTFWLQKIVSTLSSSPYSMVGSEAIRLITTDNPNCLTGKQHCQISLLHRQRIFQTFSHLADKIEVKSDNKEAYLLSWSYVLAKAPKSVLKNEVVKIAPVVIDSLEIDNKDLLLIMTDVLVYFVQIKSSLIVDSLQTILPRLVQLSCYVKSMDVRIKSLECLHDIAAAYRTSSLLPYKQDVLLDLAPSLDDHKRLVRSAAVKARSRWFLIGAPGEAKEN